MDHYEMRQAYLRALALIEEQMIEEDLSIPLEEVDQDLELV
jgi:hypothetical protein